MVEVRVTPERGGGAHFRCVLARRGRTTVTATRAATATKEESPRGDDEEVCARRYRRWRDAINTSATSGPDEETARRRARGDGAQLLRGDERRPRIFFRGGAVLRARRRPRVRSLGGPVPIRGATVTAAVTQRSTAASSSPRTPAQRASKKRARDVSYGKRFWFSRRETFRFSVFGVFGGTRLEFPRTRVVNALLRITAYYCVSALARKCYSRASSSSTPISIPEVYLPRIRSDISRRQLNGLLLDRYIEKHRAKNGNNHGLMRYYIFRLYAF